MKNQLSQKQSKQDIIRLTVELCQAGMIKVEYDEEQQLRIIPIGFNNHTWTWLLGKWGIDQTDAHLMDLIARTLNIKK